jgi:phosphatidylglycerol:prolipoprotein diacylglycerol transferase
VLLATEIPWGPDITSIGSFLLTWHGLFTAVGILVGVWIALSLAKVIGYDYDDAYALALVGVPSGIVGARLLFVAEAWDFYGSNPGEILHLTEGGISIWGGILGGVGGALAFALWKHYPVGRGLDIAAGGLIVGQAIGRLGDLVNGEHLAKATDLPWGVIYTNQDSPAFAHSIAVGAHHPATTYELLGDLVIFGVVLYMLFRVFWHRPGLTFFVYLVSYAVMRFFLTYTRVDSSETFLFDLRVPQLVSVLVVLAAMPAIWYFAKQPPIEAPAPPLGRLLVLRR